MDINRTGPESFHPDVDQWVGKVKKKKTIYWVIILLVVLWIGSSSWYIVEADQEGVVRTFGEVTAVTQPGFHLKLPTPIQKVDTPYVTKVQRVEVGFRTVKSGSQERAAQYVSVPEEALMLTGDDNIVYVEFIVQYKVKDSVDYLFKVENPDGTVRRVAESAMREVVGRSDIDDVLTDQKVEIQTEVQNLMQETLDLYNAGIFVMAVQLQDVQPPDAVKPAFKAVVDAKEGQVEAINRAEEYRNTQLPQARGEEARMLEEAEGYRIARVEKAYGDAARFTAMLEEYQKSEDITRTRLYHEMLQEVLPGISQIYIMDESGDTVKYLPLDRLSGREGQ